MSEPLAVIDEWHPTFKKTFRQIKEKEPTLKDHEIVSSIEQFVQKELAEEVPKLDLTPQKIRMEERKLDLQRKRFNEKKIKEKEENIDLQKTIYTLKISIERKEVMERDAANVPDFLYFHEYDKSISLPKPLDLVKYQQETMELLGKKEFLTLQEWDAVFRSPFIRFRHVLQNVSYSQDEHHKFKEQWNIKD